MSNKFEERLKSDNKLSELVDEYVSALKAQEENSSSNAIIMMEYERKRKEIHRSILSHINCEKGSQETCETCGGVCFDNDLSKYCDDILIKCKVA